MAGVHAHTPVLIEEVLAALTIDEGSRAAGYYLDATFGRGGHSAAILERLGVHGRLVALDRDLTAITHGKKVFGTESRLLLAHCDFGRVGEAVRAIVVDDVNWNGGFAGVLFDLGVSSPQLDDASRGFSFSHEGPLDMRMDNSKGATAAEWLARVREDEIVRVLREYGEERFAKRIARAILSARAQQPLQTTAQLAAVVAAAVPTREPGKHPATRTFQAIRIQVNSELEQIKAALAQMLDLLLPDARLCVISFHSLEDRIVKEFMQRHSQEDPVYAGLPHVPPHAQPKLRRIGRAIHPSAAEIERNPRARSAILRVAEKCDATRWAA
ncbi:MAG: 16S rRNA (cytosine(1402)-N(4))-methyltransferase RsmH [Candidatus Obscuribacterales bacterium]|nr:16S rRNA (cytosine(1402)-N(4))-methyltransferase RsmH [Steroidobacteraceae bacterium]